MSKSWPKMSLGICEASAASMASKQASLPSSCGILVYRLDTSIVASIAFFGMGVFSKSTIRWGESFMYEGVVGTRGLIMWSRKAEMRSVGPLQLLTIAQGEKLHVPLVDCCSIAVVYIMWLSPICPTGHVKFLSNCPTQDRAKLQT